MKKGSIIRKRIVFGTYYQIRHQELPIYYEVQCVYEGKVDCCRCSIGPLPEHIYTFNKEECVEKKNMTIYLTENIRKQLLIRRSQLLIRLHKNKQNLHLVDGSFRIITFRTKGNPYIRKTYVILGVPQQKEEHIEVLLGQYINRKCVRMKN